MHKFIKKIIALNRFDDYYNKFGCKDLDKKAARMITLNEKMRTLVLTGLAKSAK